MSLRLLTILLIFMVGFGLVTADAAHARRFSSSTPINIGMVLDGPSEIAPNISKDFEKEILALVGDEFKLRFPNAKRLQADWTLTGIKKAVDQLLADPEVDLIITLGAFSSHEIATRKQLSKPVIAAVIINRKLQELPFTDGNSGIANLSYISFPSDMDRDLKVFHELIPFTRLTCIADNLVANIIPEIEGTCEKAAKRVGAKANYIGVTTSADEALAAITDTTQAVFLTPLLRFSSNEFNRLINGLNQRRLPTFAMSGKRGVARGALAGVAPAVDIDRIIRRTALNVQRILLGENAGGFPVDIGDRDKLVINMATARAIGFSPKWSILRSAELVHADQEQTGRELSLNSVVQEAVQVNLDLRAAEKNVASGAQDIRQARSSLLPQLGLSSQYTEIDDDRIFAPGQAERTSTGSVTLNQVIYSEPAWSNLAIQKAIQRSREYERDRVRLDIVLDTANAYLDVLRAKSVERIQKENLVLTRSNLELARVRRKVGTAGPSEVYRWESELATDQQVVNDAVAQRQQAEIALNRLRNRPQEETFVTVETGVDDPVLLSSHERLYEYTNNPIAFTTFRDFMVQQGVSTSPEQKQLQASIAAQERALKSARRAYWQPELVLSADRTEIMSRKGVEIPTIADDKETTVGVQLSIPLLTSGARSADKVRAYEELQRLQLELQATEERVEQRIRSALHAVRSSYAGIELSRNAADAARKNLKVIKDAYTRGTASILDLLDAQNAAVVAKQSAANAVYDFLKDLMEMERAIARFDFFTTPEEQTAWFEKLDAFYRQRGGTQ